MNHKVIVTEQKPVSNSIFCSLKLEDEGGNSLIMNIMYFVCDLEKRVVQYPFWIDSYQEYKQQIINLGYKFK